MSGIKPRGNSWTLGLFLHSDVDESELTVYEFRVYAHLCRRANDEMRVWEGQKRIAAICHMSRAAVQRALYSLRDKGWIELHEQYREDGSQKPNDIIMIGPPASVRGTPPPPTDAPPASERGSLSKSIEVNPASKQASEKRTDRTPLSGFGEPAPAPEEKSKQGRANDDAALQFFDGLCGYGFVSAYRSHLARWHEEYSAEWLHMAWKLAPTMKGVRVPKVGFVWLLNREKPWPEDLTRLYSRDQKTGPAGEGGDTPMLGELRVTNDGREGRVIEIDTDERKLTLQVGEDSGDCLWVPWSVTRRSA